MVTRKVLTVHKYNPGDVICYDGMDGPEELIVESYTLMGGLHYVAVVDGHHGIITREGMQNVSLVRRWQGFSTKTPMFSYQDLATIFWKQKQRIARMQVKVDAVLGEMKAMKKASIAANMKARFVDSLRGRVKHLESELRNCEAARRKTMGDLIDARVEIRRLEAENSRLKG